MTRTDPKGIPAPDGFVIAFIIMAIGAVCTVGASAWEARYTLPVAYARAEPFTESAKLPDRLPVLPVKTVSYRLDAPVRWVPLPWTCPEIRAYAKTHTEAELHAKADAYRLTPQQRAIAKACLEGRR